jgi:hypothetical protein
LASASFNYQVDNFEYLAGIDYIREKTHPAVNRNCRHYLLVFSLFFEPRVFKEHLAWTTTDVFDQLGPLRYIVLRVARTFHALP